MGTENATQRRNGGTENATPTPGAQRNLLRGKSLRTSLPANGSLTETVILNKTP